MCRLTLNPRIDEPSVKLYSTVTVVRIGEGLLELGLPRDIQIIQMISSSNEAMYIFGSLETTNRVYTDLLFIDSILTVVRIPKGLLELGLRRDLDVVQRTYSSSDSGLCPGSVPWSAAGWPAAGGMAYSKVRPALAKSRWLFAAL